MGSTRWMNGDEAVLRESKDPVLKSQQSRHEDAAGWDERFMLMGPVWGRDGARRQLLPGDRTAARGPC